jgi:hypothetical protein
MGGECDGDDQSEVKLLSATYHLMQKEVCGSRR